MFKFGKKYDKMTGSELVIEILDRHIKECAKDLVTLDPKSNEYSDTLITLEHLHEEKAKFLEEQPKPKEKRFQIKIGGEVITALIGAGVAVWSTNKVLNYQKDDNILDTTQSSIVKPLITPKLK